MVQIKDNMVVHSMGEEHNVRLEAALQRLEEHIITLSREKCFLGHPDTIWFSKIFGKKGMCLEP